MLGVLVGIVAGGGVQIAPNLLNQGFDALAVHRMAAIALLVLQIHLFQTLPQLHNLVRLEIGLANSPHGLSTDVIHGRQSIQRVLSWILNGCQLDQ